MRNVGLRYKLAGATAIAALCLLGVASPAGALVLGSPSYVPSYGAGWGTSMPALISNGGVPSGVIDQIAWTGWGEPVATGVGRTSIYRPQGGYYGARPKVPLRAGDVGTCPGQTEAAYRTLEFRVPPWPGGPLGPWLKWSGSLDICDYSIKDPRYDYPRQPPGICGNIGDDYEPGDILGVETFLLACSQGRKVARRAESGAGARLPHRCARRGCARAVGAFRCRWYPLRSGETTIDISIAYPVQRVACRNGRATITWRFVLNFD